jgi:hypothetical protein
MAISTSGVSVPQLGQTVDASIYGNQNAPKPMTIADMLDINKKQLELSKSKETYEADVAGKKAESQRLQTEAQKAGIDLNMHTQNMSNSVYGGYLTDPDFISGNSAKMVEKLKRSRTYLEDNGLVPPNQGKGHDALLDLAKNDPAAAYQMIKNGVQQSGGNASQYQSLQATQPTSIYQGNQPPVTAPPANQAQDQFSQPEPIPAGYKPPVAGQPRATTPSEEGDRIVGEKYRQELKPIQNQYGVLKQNYDKLISQAEKVAGDTIFSGPAGTAERTLRAKIGTPEYQQLSKDLAKAQIADIQANGGNLEGVAGQQLLATANGQVTYDPKVLIDMARRNAAILERKNSESYGADKASDKFGDAILNRKFRAEWNKNSNDNAVFEMQYIFKSANSPEEGAARVAKYIKDNGHTPEKRKELATKYLNLQKLQNEGSL